MNIRVNTITRSYDLKKYKGSVFFDWHHYLTGSCLMGRESFVKNHGINLDDEFTVDEFIKLCRDD